MKTISEKAEYFRSFFELKDVPESRSASGKIWINKDHENQLVVDLCFSAHDNGNMLPDDFRYSKIVDILDLIAEENDDYDHIIERIENIEPDIYTSDLTAWLHSRNDRVYYLTEALEEGIGITDGFQLLAYAQKKEIQEIGNAVLEYLIENEIEEEEE